MPIYKRYYLSSLPGLSWLADFYITHWLHYLFAAVLMGLAVYGLALLFLAFRKTRRPSISGMVRGILLAGIILTGILLVFYNLPGSSFSQGSVIILDLAHMLFAMAFLVAGLVSVIRRQPWTRPRSQR